MSQRKTRPLASPSSKNARATNHETERRARILRQSFLMLLLPAHAARFYRELSLLENTHHFTVCPAILWDLKGLLEALFPELGQPTTVKKSRRMVYPIPPVRELPPSRVPPKVAALVTRLQREDIKPNLIPYNPDWMKGPPKAPKGK